MKLRDRMKFFIAIEKKTPKLLGLRYSNGVKLRLVSLSCQIAFLYFNIFKILSMVFIVLVGK